MNVYLSTAQAKSIVLQLMQIFPEGVSLCDEDGVILSSSDTGRINRTSPLAKQCIEQANSGKPYNERVVDGNVTATPLFFKDVCVGAVLMLFEITAPLAFVLLWFYNGERGRCPQWAKWAFYGFYPVHLTLLALVTNLLLA